VIGENSKPLTKGFCIFVDSICEGRVPLWRDGDGKFVVYESEVAAQREIVDDLMIRLQEFLDGYRDFEDAMCVEEYVSAVSMLADGSLMDEDGNVFGRGQE
jgi:hypothetical protein